MSIPRPDSIKKEAKKKGRTYRSQHKQHVRMELQDDHHTKETVATISKSYSTSLTFLPLCTNKDQEGQFETYYNRK